ncbi:MAG: c-type cytochrome, partial [Hyphomicrobiales bacterium]
DAASGQKKAAICSTCHSFGKGDASKPTGPNLWGIVGRVHAANKDFEYSAVNKELGAKGEKWTYDAIFEFIKSPKTYMSGTKMTFAGHAERGGSRRRHRLSAQPLRQPRALAGGDGRSGPGDTEDGPGSTENSPGSAQAAA